MSYLSESLTTSCGIDPVAQLVNLLQFKFKPYVQVFISGGAQTYIFDFKTE